MTAGDFSGFEFRPAAEGDLDDMLSAEKLCFSEPWSRDSMRYILPGPNMHSLICRESGSGKLCAYAGLAHVLDEGEIVNIAVVPEFRRRGLGREMIERLFGFCRENGIGTIYLEVREGNTAARALYSSAGFGECGKRKKYYSNPTEDAVLMMNDGFSSGDSSVLLPLGQ